jgi:hypothetical protein
MKQILKVLSDIADEYDNKDRSAENGYGGGFQVKIPLSICRKAREILKKPPKGLFS